MPLSCLRNVKAIPPPMIISETLSSKFSMRRILSATLAPPKIARNGLGGQKVTKIILNVKGTC